MTQSAPDPSNTPIDQLTAPLDPDDDAIDQLRVLRELPTTADLDEEHVEDDEDEVDVQF